MKLELKHIAPYLLYELQMIGKFGQTETLNLSNINHALQYWKPILRPLSDLTKEIEIDGHLIIPINQISTSYPDRDYIIKVAKIGAIENLDYWQMKSLIEWHFDVFGLIKEGLAVDINSLVEFNGSFNSH